VAATFKETFQGRHLCYTALCEDTLCSPLLRMYMHRFTLAYIYIYTHIYIFFGPGRGPSRTNSELAFELWSFQLPGPRKHRVFRVCQPLGLKSTVFACAAAPRPQNTGLKTPCWPKDMPLGLKAPCVRMRQPRSKKPFKEDISVTLHSVNSVMTQAHLFCAWIRTGSQLYEYIYIYSSFAYAPDGACEVEQSKVGNSAATPKKEKEVRTEHSRFESAVRSSAATLKER